MLYICYYIMIIFKLYFHASKELRERERVILMFDILVKILKQMDMKLNLTQLKLNKCKIRDIPLEKFNSIEFKTVSLCFADM